MKKSFILFIVLLALSVGTVCMAQTELLQEKDQVNFTEKILYGDKSIIEGVTVEMKNYYPYQMYWDSVYTIGEKPKVQTEYQFYPWERYENNYELPRAFGMMHDSEDAFLETYAKAELSDLEGLAVAWRELYDQVGAGEEQTITIQLNDYLEYYTFSASFSSPTESGIPFSLHLWEKELRENLKVYAGKRDQIAKLEKHLSYLEAFQEFFKIPIVDGEVHKLAMRKDNSGKVIGSAIASATMGSGTGTIDIPNFPVFSETDYFYFSTITAMTETDCYFTFDPYTYQGKVVDTSQIPGGYGIYHFPYDADKGEIYPEELRMVYALDPKEEEVYYMCMDHAEKNLLLFTIKNEQLYLSVIDKETMTLRNKLEIGNQEQGVSVWVYEGYVVLEAEELILLTIDETGNYTKQFSIPDEMLHDRIKGAAEENGAWLFWGDTEFDWDGETLVFAGFLHLEASPSCGFYVAAVNTEGLQYCATYESSLMTARRVYGKYAACQPVGEKPVTIWFADTP